jgi:hypothetical protein
MVKELSTHSNEQKSSHPHLTTREGNPSDSDRVSRNTRNGKKKAATKKKSAQPSHKQPGSKSKDASLNCRYCGSSDLAPSFIERRDRRCRKCFSKRYGSSARAKKLPNSK